MSNICNRNVAIADIPAEVFEEEKTRSVELEEEDPARKFHSLREWRLGALFGLPMKKKRTLKGRELRCASIILDTKTSSILPEQKRFPSL